jgi:hypothetical protein
VPVVSLFAPRLERLLCGLQLLFQPLVLFDLLVIDAIHAVLVDALLKSLGEVVGLALKRLNLLKETEVATRQSNLVRLIPDLMVGGEYPVTLIEVRDGRQGERVVLRMWCVIRAHANHFLGVGQYAPYLGSRSHELGLEATRFRLHCDSKQMPRKFAGLVLRQTKLLIVRIPVLVTVV